MDLPEGEEDKVLASERMPEGLLDQQRGSETREQPVEVDPVGGEVHGSPYFTIFARPMRNKSVWLRSAPPQQQGP